ncbi:unnamed protein product [Adineta steineri]|uniref:Uncharacterized protein n=1 Tax=Adineta steineri TaxID=433720 RepID=A0A815SG96_9BILA|nr:unnamed protein product [Adineta steineri]
MPNIQEARNNEQGFKAWLRRRQEWVGCLLATCCTASGLITIGAVVAIALIPVYLSTQGGTISDTNKGTSLNLAFATDYSPPSDTTRPTIQNMQDLATQVEKMAKVDSGTLTATYSQFTNQVETRRRRRTSMCDASGNTSLAADFLQISFSVTYPKRCGKAIESICATRFLNNITIAIRGLITFKATIEINGSAPIED